MATYKTITSTFCWFGSFIFGPWYCTPLLIISIKCGEQQLYTKHTIHVDAKGQSTFVSFRLVFFYILLLLPLNHSLARSLRSSVIFRWINEHRTIDYMIWIWYLSCQTYFIFIYFFYFWCAAISKVCVCVCVWTTNEIQRKRVMALFIFYRCHQLILLAMCTWCV